MQQQQHANYFRHAGIIAAMKDVYKYTLTYMCTAHTCTNTYEYERSQQARIKGWVYNQAVCTVHLVTCFFLYFFPSLALYFIVVVL